MTEDFFSKVETKEAEREQQERERRERRGIPTPTAPEAPPAPPRGPTLAENLRGSRNTLLSAYIKTLPDAERLAAMLDKDPGKNSFGELQKLNDDFNKLVAQIDEVKDAITPEGVAKFAEADPSLRMMLQIAGPEELAAAFSGQIETIALEDQRRFKALKNSFQAISLHHAREEGLRKEINEAVKRVGERTGVVEDKIAEIMAAPPGPERDRLLTAELKTLFPRGWEWKHNYAARISNMDTKFRAEDVGGKLAGLKTHRGELTGLLAKAGKVLAKALEEDEGLRRAFMREAKGEREEKLPEMQFREVKAQLETPKQLEDRWEAEKGALKLPAVRGGRERRYTEFTDAEKEDARDKWLGVQREAVVKSAQEQTGWAWFWLSLMTSLYDAAKKNNSLKL